MAEIEFHQVILEALLKWRNTQTKARASVSLNAFAKYLGVSRPAVSQWLNDKRTPELESLEIILPKLAELLGPSVYEKLGRSRPDDQFGQLKTQYDLVPQAEKEKFLDEVRKLLIEHGWTKED